MGIGTQIKSHENGILVDKLIAGGPALDQLAKGDIIMRADGVWLDDLPLQSAVEVLLGEAETEVELLVKRPTEDGSFEELTVVLERGRIRYSN